ncbi:MAG TPA: tRNA pseudouridine(13) synthase TruD [Caldilineae bacterium]|nr:tRNA pseudouridine(13) synthase TruD [Caldilineae bacterium]
METQLADLTRIQSLPFITAELPGIGGEIKAEPAHFIVEEIPLYEPVGEGEHFYVRITREGWTTRALQQRLMQLFGLREIDVGCAGLKDKHARVTQTFSLLLREMDEEAVARRIEEALPVQVVWVRRHRNKLRAGHLLGNRFRIVVLHPHPDALPRAEAIAEALRARGLPNYYGAQRFGVNGDNAQRGREVLFGRGPRERWLRRFLLSAYQAALFNIWLAERIERGWFDRLFTGDIAKKTDTGGLFEVADAEAEMPRFQRREITYTGPIYGARMRWASGIPGELEREVLSAAGVTIEMLRKARLDGSRRAARLFLEDLSIEPHPDGLLFSFTLPKGAYATTVLREFMKTEATLPEE